jgi:hypothetical protein
MATKSHQLKKTHNQKRVWGRPTKFKSGYCQRIVNFMARGLTATAFAGSLGISRDSVYEWAREHRDFSDALKVARARQVEYWEKRLLVAGKKKGDATPVIFALKNACPDEWRDTQRLEHSGPNGGSIRIAEVASVEDIERDLMGLGALDAKGRLIIQKN